MNQTVAGTLATKRWDRLTPIAFIPYSLAYLDRANYGFGAADGLARDLTVTPAISALPGALFFLGDFCLQVPGGICAAKRLIFRSLMLWGALAAAIPKMIPRNVVAGAMPFVVCFGALCAFAGAWMEGSLNCRWAALRHPVSSGAVR